MPETFRTILLTGGTGSLGQALTRFLLDQTQAIIRIYSRSELRQAQMQRYFASDRLRFFLGDVRDLARLHTALLGVDCCFHAAALKRIDAGEYCPEEFIKTNVHGTENVVSACRTMGVHKAVLISTDKASQPLNVYGASKLVAEKLWTRANAYTPLGTSYSTIRYGNVSGSNGSVIPLWRQALRDGKPLPVTHPEMSRFWISLEEAVQLAWFAAQYAPRGSVLVPRLPAYSVKTLAQALVAEAGMPWEQVVFQDIGVRPGEKRHEQLLTEEEAASTVAYGEEGSAPLYYCIPPVEPSWRMPPVEAWHAPDLLRGLWGPAPVEHPYRSDTWPWRLTVQELCDRLKEVS